jgi:hypothetical protein
MRRSSRPSSPGRHPPQANHEAELILREARTDAAHRGPGPGRRAGCATVRALHRQFAVYLANFRALLERPRQVEGYQVHSRVMHQVQTELLLKRQS